MQKCYPFKVSATDICPDGRHADYAEGIQWVIDEGISNGTSAAKFLPDEQCTRAQVVTFIWRAAGRPAPKNGTCTFYDVSDGSYCAKAVQWAVEQGLTKGVSAGYFDPYGKVTRAQFVTLLWRYLGQTEPGHRKSLCRYLCRNILLSLGAVGIRKRRDHRNGRVYVLAKQRRKPRPGRNVPLPSTGSGREAR